MKGILTGLSSKSTKNPFFNLKLSHGGRDLALSSIFVNRITERNGSEFINAFGREMETAVKIVHMFLRGIKIGSDGFEGQQKQKILQFCCKKTRILKDLRSKTTCHLHSMIPKKPVPGGYDQ